MYLFLCLNVLGLHWDTQAFSCHSVQAMLPLSCGILVPQPGIRPQSAALEGRFLATGPPVKS